MYIYLPHGIAKSELLHVLQILLLEFPCALLVLLGFALVLSFRITLGSSDLLVENRDERSNWFFTERQPT